MIVLVIIGIGIGLLFSNTTSAGAGNEGGVIREEIKVGLPAQRCAENNSVNSENVCVFLESQVNNCLCGEAMPKGKQMKDLSRKVSLHCPVCGNTMFSNVDESLDNTNLAEAPGSTLFKCSDCGNVISKDDLIKANEGVINANVEDVKNEALKEFDKELKKLFKGNKNIKIK